MNYKKFFLLFVIIAILVSSCLSADAASYRSYLYEKGTGKALEAPAAAVPQSLITGSSLGIGNFKNPSDMFIDGEQNIYVLDSDNSRVVCLNSDLDTVKYILSGTEDFSFSGAQGLYVNSQDIYIADTVNGRILKYKLPVDQSSADIAVQHCTEIKPSDMLLDSDTVFKPMKLAVDEVGRIFIVCQGIYDGLVELAGDGRFLAYIGSNKISLTIGQQIWKAIASREQWDASEKSEPVEFSNICPDSDGFMYTTSRGKTEGYQLIRRLNLNGKDVLVSDDEEDLGDFEIDKSEGETYFVDVAVGSGETFSALDQTRGRVFVYDNRCNLLFEFGGMGTQIGKFQNPTSLIWLKDKRFCVLDTLTGEITVFRTTDYGSLILSSVTYEAEGKYDSAVSCYSEILEMNANNEFAYIGMAKQFYRDGEYEKALQYAKIGNSREYYSKAFVQYRKAKLNVIIPVVIILILVIAVSFLIVWLVRGVKTINKNINNIMLMDQKLQQRERKSKNCRKG